MGVPFGCGYECLSKAFECQLVGIKPMYDKWRSDALEKFNVLVTGKELTMKVGPIFLSS